MYSVGGQHADHPWSEGLGSSPICIDRKENLLKVQRYEKARLFMSGISNLALLEHELRIMFSPCSQR